MFAQITQLPNSSELLKPVSSDPSFGNVYLFAFLILGAFLGLFIIFWLTFRSTQKRVPVSPYSGQPLRFAEDLSYYNMEKVLRYILTMRDYHNQIITFRKSAFCRETGRIFSNCVNWFGNIEVDWSFLQKRYPGVYVSWGSLSESQQAAIRDMHDSLAGFQTEYSSAEPLPKAIEPRYAFLKPGPLYVDINTYVLLGWKVVPGTNLEILVVQRPRVNAPTHFTPDD